MGKQNKHKGRSKLKRVDPFNTRARQFQNKEEDESIDFKKIDKKLSDIPSKLRNIMQSQDMMKRYDEEKRKIKQKSGFIVEKELKKRVFQSIEKEKEEQHKRKRANADDKNKSRKQKTENTPQKQTTPVVQKPEQPEQNHEGSKLKDFSDFTDVVKFGEVADRPPTFQKLPKVRGIPKVEPIDPSQKIPNIQQLRLTKKLQQQPALTPQQKEEQDEIERVRADVLSKYKQIKKKRVQELIQQQKAKQLVASKSKKKKVKPIKDEM